MASRAEVTPTIRDPSRDATTEDQCAAETGLSFIKIPLEALGDPRLLPISKLVYGRLILFAGKDGRCCPSHATLATEVCTRARNVRRCLDQLRDENYISWKRTPRGNAYRLTDRTLTTSQDRRDRSRRTYHEVE